MTCPVGLSYITCPKEAIELLNFSVFTKEIQSKVFNFVLLKLLIILELSCNFELTDRISFKIRSRIIRSGETNEFLIRTLIMGLGCTVLNK